MALSEPQVNDISEDQEANELFNIFMDITKEEAIMDLQPDNSTEAKKDGQQKNVDDTVEKEESTATHTQETQEKTNEIKSEKDLSEEAKENVSTSLSKAVNELSDLEKQLSLMISGAPKQCIQVDNVSRPSEVVDTDDGGVIVSVNGDKSDDTKESEPKSTESADRETALADGDGDREVKMESKGENQKETIEKESHANVDEDTEISPKSNEDGVRDTCNESEHEREASESQPSGESLEKTTNSNEDGVKKTGSESAGGEETSNVSNDATVEEKRDENTEIDVLCEDTPADLTASEQQDPDQKNNNVEKPNTSVKGDIKPVETVDGKPEGAKEEQSEESSTELKDDNRKSSSAAEIEILMTDESGISERKSLDSLDSLDDNDQQGRSNSPALSDEGIDLDSKSDIADDDDTFDTTSSDFSIKSKSSLLEVDRNRTGSDSSTFSEQEFKRDISDKTDGDNGEAADHISIQGYLLKLGGSGLTPRNWRKRWFVLKGDNCLYYYKHAKDKVPCGVIILCNYSITKAPEYSRKCCFKLNKGGARSYHLCASNDDEMREWMVALMAASSEVAPDGSSFQISEGNVHNVSIPALSIRDPECHGYLSKQGHNIKNWKRRYCVLKNGYLYYYSDMSNTTALGVAKLLGYSIKMGDKRGKHYCFYGSPPDDSLRTYHFSAETENDRDRWMTRMAESILKGNTSNTVSSE